MSSSSDVTRSRRPEPAAFLRSERSSPSADLSAGLPPDLAEQLRALLQQLIRDLLEGGDLGDVDLGVIMMFIKILSELARPDGGVKRHP